MSQTPWAFIGIGYEQTGLISLMDGDKLANLVKEMAKEPLEENELEEGYAFSTLPNDKKVDVLMQYFIEDVYDWQLPELLMKKADKQVFSYGENDGNYFLLYHPRYPWEESGGFKSQEEVVKYICDLVRPYCRDDVSENELFEIINPDIFEVGYN
jgi:hypothetical protein